MSMREAILTALRRDPDLMNKVSEALRDRLDEKEGSAPLLVQAAKALEPILAEAAEKRPSRWTKLGLKSAAFLGALAESDDEASRRLAKMAKGSHTGIVFADISGFTAWTAEHGDEAAIEVLSRIGGLVERAAAGEDGECVKRLGDGFLLAFPSATQAIRGALWLGHAMREQGEKVRGLSLRIAVHSGTPRLDRNDLIGHDVNLTARLLDQCNPGEVIVTEAAKGLAEPSLEKVFERRRTVGLRGVKEEVSIYSASL